MKSRSLKLAFSILGIVALTLIINELASVVSRSVALSSDDPDYEAIENTLVFYAEYQAIAKSTLDDSLLTKVIANDPRGGQQDKREQQAVRFIKNSPNLKGSEIGLLDATQARFEFLRRARQLYYAAIEKGVEPTSTPDDPFENPVPLELKGTDLDRSSQEKMVDPNDIPEIQELLKATGYSGIKLPSGEPIEPLTFELIWVRVYGDIAHATVEWRYARVDDVFVKKDGKWYLIGEKILEPIN